MVIFMEISDISVEQIIKQKASNNSIIFKVVMIIACILAATTIPSTQSFGFLVLCMLIVFTAMLFRHYKIEIEYAIVDNELIVDKITARNSRRRCGRYSLEKAELIAKKDSQAALRMAHKDLRTYDYTSRENEQNIVIMYTYNDHNEMERILLEPNERITERIKEIVPKQCYKLDEN
ncbi:MAG: hypothetical protein HFJ03_02845 [Lachnospira sp.]|nr:hypothetical protein [Lachnospira sp.]